jgi:hypothetical protein
MDSDTQKEQYDKALNALGLSRDKDPFPLDPPKSVDYWADNKEILQKMIKAQLDSTMFASSFIYILYGPVGGGKTFAIKYFANPEVQKAIFHTIQKPELESLNIRVAAIVPLRSGQLTFSLHKNIIEKCFSIIEKNQALLKAFIESKDFGEGDVRRSFRNIKSSIHRSFEGKLSIMNLENNEGYKFLTQSKSQYGKLKDVNELVETIRILIAILSKRFRRTVISIDELENLARATGTERFLCSDFFRKLHETIEHDLSIFLIFTFESFEDIASLLQPALLSRVKERIEFSFVKDSSTIREYIAECISKRCNVNPYEVITEDVVSEIASSLIDNFRGGLSFRAINAEMYRVFANTYISASQPEKYRIDMTLYERAIKIPSTADVMKQITERLAKGERK